MKRKLFFLILGTLFLSACSVNHIDSDETALEFFPSKATAKDIVYLETVDQPHEILGTISVNTERRWDRDTVIEKIKREAALIGGDAFTNIQEKPPVIKGKFKNAYLRTNYTAEVVKFTGAGPAPE